VLDFNALPEAAIRFEKGLVEKGVQLRLGQTIKAVRVIEDDSHPLGRTLEVTFSTGEVDRFDEITVAHGMRCNLDFVRPGSLEMDQALVVDDCMRTSNPDVYAAGDVAQATELITREKRIVGIWKNAAVQGACAGRAIAAEVAGRKVPADALYPGSIPANTIAVKGTLFISAGAMDVTPNRRVEVQEDDEMTVVSLFEAKADGAERLIGFNLVCDRDEAGSTAYDTGAMLTLRIEKAL
jgi:NADPH-dependent 2,4-dienoyl-CoA reductase/sulfur reductase-like enzyme